MTTEFKLPELGENVEAGDIIKVLVSTGDNVEVDQPVLELETDKATIEVPSSVSGVVKEVHVKEGEKATVGQVILTVEGTSEDGNGTEPKPETETEKEEAVPQKTEPEPEPAKAEQSSPAVQEGSKTTVEFKLPDLGENIESGDVVNVLVSTGDTIEVDQPVLELETDKATIEVPTSAGGVVQEIHVNEGEKASVGQLILTIETSEAAIEKAAHAAAEAEARAPEERSAEELEEFEKQEVAKARREEPQVERTTPVTDRLDRSRTAVAAAPNVRRLAREIGVDITQVEGSGPFGRISMDDVKRYARSLRRDGRGAAPGVSIAAKPLPDFAKWGEINREPMSNVRRATAEHLSQAWLNIPHVTNFDKADIGELEKLRKRFAPKADEAGGKLTITAILLKVVAAGLKKFPQFNASVDMANREVVYKNYYHVGVAVDTDRGLLVPSIRNVDQKNILALAVELSEISEKARNGKLSLEEMQGSTFTITNLGGIGGTNFTPIINSPEVAILGVSRGQYEPIYREGEFEPRLMLPLSLSYDHRLIDGADAARFLRWMVQTLEEPFMMSLQGW